MWCSFGNLPTGEILLANPKANDNDDSSFIPIHSHYHSAQMFQRFVLGRFTPCIIEKSSAQISCVNSSYRSLKVSLRC